MLVSGKLTFENGCSQSQPFLQDEFIAGFWVEREHTTAHPNKAPDLSQKVEHQSLASPAHTHILA